MYRLHARLDPHRNRYYRATHLRVRYYTLPNQSEAALFQHRVSHIGLPTWADQNSDGTWYVRVDRYDPRSPGEQYDDAHR